MTRPTLDQALQVARDLGACEWCGGTGLIVDHFSEPRQPETADGRCGACGGAGVAGEVSPAVVTWLARWALHHPQVSAAVAAALPSSGVRWGSVWSVSDERTAPDGDVLGWVRDLSDGEGFGPWNWQVRHPTLGYIAGQSPEQDAARAEVDERLIAAGHTLLGAVYRTGEPTRCGARGIHGHQCDLAAGHDGSHHHVMPFRTLADAAERDMPAGLLAGPPEDEPEPYGTWTDDPNQPRCPMCGVQAKWSAAHTGLTNPMPVRVACQDGQRVSRRFPGIGPPCPWLGANGLRYDDGTILFTGGGVG